ncbi:MAG: hypothetical protein L3K14_05285 [Thermoplasmata archaeon]|nr:hypothetical protein [Thermoplasmata archaeon]
MSASPRSLFLAPPSQKTFVGMNRSALRGYVWIGAALLIVLGIFSWPDLRWVAGFLISGALMTVAGLWVLFTLDDGDRDPNNLGGTETDREPLTGEMD